MTIRGVYDLERQLPPVLADMERVGVLLDTDRLLAIGTQLADELGAVRARLGALNPASPKQVAGVLYDDLKLPVLHTTKTGQRATDEDTIKRLLIRVGVQPVALDILKVRGLLKLQGTYIEALPKLVGVDNRLHPSWLQFVASTGRMACRNPNLQNQPAHGEYGAAVRGAFIAASGYGLVAGDYSQIELRIMAHLSQEPVLLGAFQRGEDVHLVVTMALGLPPELRWLGKNLNFGLSYGMESESLALHLTDFEAGRIVSVQQAKKYKDLYWGRLPTLYEYFESVKWFARKYGWVETALGRRQPVRLQGARWQQEATLRMAANHPIQGGAADIVKRLMPGVWGEACRIGGHLILQVHDELVCEVPQGEAVDFASNMKLAAETQEHLSVPLEMVVGVGSSWLEAKP